LSSRHVGFEDGEVVHVFRHKDESCSDVLLDECREYGLCRVGLHRVNYFETN